MKISTTVFAAIVSLAFTFGSAQTEASNILLYAPGGTGSLPIMTGVGHSITVSNFSGMTTSDFGAFDAIWVDSNDCATSGSYQDALFNSQNIWGPVVDGRVVVATTDADFHISTALPSAQRFVENVSTWISDLGATGASGSTGMYYTTGCAALSGFSPDLSAVFGAGFSFTSIDTDGMAIAPGGIGHPLTTTPNALTDARFLWNTFCHGDIQTHPSDFVGIMTCNSGNPALVAREALSQTMPTPEPTTLALLALGLAAIGFRRSFH